MVRESVSEINVPTSILNVDVFPDTCSVLLQVYSRKSYSLTWVMVSSRISQLCSV